MDKEVLSGLTEEFLRYFAKKNNLEDKQIPQVNFIMDDMYAKDPFGKTAYYNPQTSKIFVSLFGGIFVCIIFGTSLAFLKPIPN